MGLQLMTTSLKTLNLFQAVILGKRGIYLLIDYYTNWCNHWKLTVTNYFFQLKGFIRL